MAVNQNDHLTQDSQVPTAQQVVHTLKHSASPGEMNAINLHGGTLRIDKTLEKEGVRKMNDGENKKETSEEE